ncbi:MAG TPA: PPC domain-containing DNA-binding protein [Patescibacteria group bacterium]|nr:PPC domain-containing DNA-binding protein [Patescibacteria group bacterium]
MLTGKIERIRFARFNEDDDLIESVKKVAEENNIHAAGFFVIGALKNAVLGFYAQGNYTTIKLKEHVEIASCTGNIALGPEGEIIVHAHIVVSNEKGRAFGGHLFAGNRVGPTAELVLFEGIGVDLQRAYDERTKLKLLRPAEVGRN